LAEEAIRRKLLDWADYGAEIGRRLCDLQSCDRLRPDRKHAAAVRSAKIETIHELRNRIRDEAAVLRGSSERFVQITDVLVGAAETDVR
jgi:hypothetical protein